jgi:Ring finger domain
LLKEGVSALEMVGGRFMGALLPFYQLHRAMDIYQRALHGSLRNISELCRNRLKWESQCQQLEELESHLRNTTALLPELAEVVYVDPALVASAERQGASIASSLRRIRSHLSDLEQMTNMAIAELRQLQNPHFDTVRNEIPMALDESLGEPTSAVCAFCLEGCCGYIIRLPCTHTFHSACALRWVHTKKTCPVCRIQVNSLTRCEFLETSSEPWKALWSASYT